MSFLLVLQLTLGGLGLPALPGGEALSAGRGPTPALRAPLFRRNHGPGTTGGGTGVLSGETLREGGFAVSLRSEWTDFERVSRAGAEANALASGEFDAIDSSLLETLSIAHGLTDDVELEVELGYYAGQNFVDAEADGVGGVESGTADPRGLTDLWLRGKWRVARGPGGHVAVLGGVKLPIGEDGEKLDNGEVLEASSQPGSGAVDLQLGAAYSRYLTSRVTLSASGLYTLRGAHGGFEVGDRADVGLGLGYRLTEDVRAPNNWSVLGELRAVWIGRDEAGGVENENSGGTTLYLGAGVRNRLDEHYSIGLVPSIAVLQDVEGLQVETDWKVALTLTATW